MKRMLASYAYSFPLSREVVSDLLWSLSLIPRLGPKPIVLLSDQNPGLLRTVPVLVMNVLCPWNPSIPGKPAWLITPLPQGGPLVLWCSEWAWAPCGTRLKLVSRQDPFLWKRSQSSLTLSAMWGPREKMAGCLWTRKWALTRHWIC